MKNLWTLVILGEIDQLRKCSKFLTFQQKRGVAKAPSNRKLLLHFTLKLKYLGISIVQYKFHSYTYISSRITQTTTVNHHIIAFPAASTRVVLITLTSHVVQSENIWCYIRQWIVKSVFCCPNLNSDTVNYIVKSNVEFNLFNGSGGRKEQRFFGTARHLESNFYFVAFITFFLTKCLINKLFVEFRNIFGLLPLFLKI